MGEDMRGQRHSGEGLLKFWERKHYWEKGLYFLLGYFSGLEFGWTVTGVHQVAGSFGLGGQESSRNPGAREPDRLCS
jgi:hypothetical protein